MKSKDEIETELMQFTGTEYYHKHPLGIMYTDGIDYLCKKYSCFWLIDAVASWQFDKKVRKQEFQVFRLKVHDDKSAVLTIEDGNYNKVAEQIISFSDVQIEEIDLWFANGVCYLPSEH
jgi:hypothetical protein